MRLRRIVLGTLGLATAIAVWLEVFLRDPTIAAVLAAVALAFLDWWRRRRRLSVRMKTDQK